MNARRYVLLAILSTLFLVQAARLLAWWLQPNFGDLVRIGGYSERSYGWNGTQLEFQEPPSSFGDWIRPVDILVVGDSFANLRPNMQWQNWLAVATGWSIHTLDKHKVDLKAVVASPLYRKHPPRVVIWNTIERDLYSEMAEPDTACTATTSPGGIQLLAVQPLDLVASPFERPTGLTQANPATARLWLWRSLLRDGLKMETSEAIDLSLTRSDLFSSLVADRVLVYRRDFEGKKRWQQRDDGRIACGLVKLQRLFEANGRTRLVTALAPDKSSAYRPWLNDPKSVPESRLPALLQTSPVADARLDQALDRAITTGAKDVYLPDDTHWGTLGHQLAATAVLQLIDSLGLVQRKVSP